MQNAVTGWVRQKLTQLKKNRCSEVLPTKCHCNIQTIITERGKSQGESPKWEQIRRRTCWLSRVLQIRGRRRRREKETYAGSNNDNSRFPSRAPRRATNDDDHNIQYAYTNKVTRTNVRCYCPGRGFGVWRFCRPVGFKLHGGKCIMRHDFSVLQLMMKTLSGKKWDWLENPGELNSSGFAAKAGWSWTWFLKYAITTDLTKLLKPYYLIYCEAGMRRWWMTRWLAGGAKYEDRLRRWLDDGS